jgi:hypothetical protein
MKSLVKFSLAAAALTAISLALFLVGLAQRGANLSTLSRGSLLRLSTGLALVCLVGFFLGVAFILWRKPAQEKRLTTAITQKLAIPGLADGLIFVALMLLFGMVLTLLEILLLGSRAITPVLLRYAPALFLALAFPALVLSTPFLNPTRSRLRSILGMGALFGGLGILIQVYFVHQLDAPVSVSFWGAVRLAFGLAVLALGLAFRLLAAPQAEHKLLILLLGMIAGLFVIQWAVWPRKLRSDLPMLAILSPIIIFGLPLLATGVLAGSRWLVKRTSGRIVPVVKVLVVCSLLGLAYFYFQADLKHAEFINTSASFSDEGNYLTLIKEARRLNFRYTGDQNRMPGYVFFQALFVHPGMSDAELFEQGKRINILLSLVLLAFLFLIFLKYLSFYQATLLLLIVAFTLFIFKAPYIQAEISFYFISFLSFVLMLQMLLRPGWLLAIATGLAAGVGYLTKGTILPGVLLFAVIFGLKGMLDLTKQARFQDRAGLHQAGKSLIQLALVLVVFVAVIFPYINQMKQRFGNYFYNVNTTIYMWYDEMEQAYAGEARYHFTEHVPLDLSADQIPSLGKYAREHTLQQAFARFKDGVISELAVIGWQFSVTNYQLAYGWIFILALLVAHKNSLRTVRKYPFLIAFVMLYFLGYFVAFAWYSPIASGRRFVYGLYIPLLFALFAAINELANQQKAPPGGKAPLSIARYFTLSNLIILFTLIYNIWVVLTSSLFFDRYGS